MGLGSTGPQADLLARRERFAASLRPHCFIERHREPDHARQASVSSKTVLAST
jgi:hypothetical protein